MAELKPCPFCGSDQVTFSFYPEVDSYAFICMDCDTEVYPYFAEKRDEAIEAWNRRADNAD